MTQSETTGWMDINGVGSTSSTERLPPLAKVLHNYYFSPSPSPWDSNKTNQVPHFPFCWGLCQKVWRKNHTFEFRHRKGQRLCIGVGHQHRSHQRLFLWQPIGFQAPRGSTSFLRVSCRIREEFLPLIGLERTRLWSWPSPIPEPRTRTRPRPK